MTRINWDKTGEKRYEAGVDRGVFYHGSVAGGVPWNGLISIDEVPNGGEVTPHYIDGYLYLNEVSATDFKAVLEAFTYPEAFESVNGSSYSGGLSYENQDITSLFALSYRTMLGNDTKLTLFGYKIHMIYNCTATPRKGAHATIGNPTDPSNFTWDLVARPPVGANFYGHRPTAHIVWDSSRTEKYKTDELERILYGDSGVKPRMPSLDELEGINNWGDALHIDEKPATGLSNLLYLGSGDLRGDVTRGLYTKHPDSRLVPASTPGFFKLGA